MSSLDENVLCFPSSRLDEIGRWQGLNTSIDVVRRVFDNRLTYFDYFPRSTLEDDPKFKQVITYSLITFSNKEDNLIFSYVRGKSGGEDRLKKLKSIGIGGHVSDRILSYKKNVFKRGMDNNSAEFTLVKMDALREIEEEVVYASKMPSINLYGMINDDSNPVGQVHLGVVYRLTLSIPDCTGNEDCISDGEMVPVSSLRKNIDQYENWSKILINSF